MADTFLHGHDGGSTDTRWYATAETADGRTVGLGWPGTEAAAIALVEAAYAIDGVTAAWVREPDLTGWIVGEVTLTLGTRR